MITRAPTLEPMIIYRIVFVVVVVVSAGVNPCGCMDRLETVNPAIAFVC